MNKIQASNSVKITKTQMNKSNKQKQSLEQRNLEAHKKNTKADEEYF